MAKLLAADGGERLDRYELIAELAAGGMATVYLARNIGVAGFQRLVAIKRLHPHLAREQEFIEMFLDEARLAARIHHPNVVPIQEVGESAGGYYLVMDYIEGDTFAHVLARSVQRNVPVPLAVTVRVLLDALAGLHAAHELQDDMGRPLHLVHRDVSPQNILVGADGITRLTDFGVARAASRLSTTRSGQLKGKVAYMAPEQARGGRIDRRTDVFSCGIVLWEALALKRLFKGEGEAETMHRVLYEPIEPPSRSRPDVPRVLDAVCMKALEREIDERYPSAQALADDLERAAQACAALGSVREVASCLERVVGSDLSQQRGAVRAWLSRSEPSRPPPPSRPVESDPMRTRVEGGAKSDPPRVVDPLAETAPQPHLPLPQEKVSSVSSTVIHVEAPPSRGKWALAIFAVAVAACIGGFAFATKYPHLTWKHAPAAAKPVTTEPSAAPSSSASAVRVATPNDLPAVASSAREEHEPSPAPTTSAPRPSLRPNAKPPVTPARAPNATPPSAPAPPPPDDLSRNPYR